MSITNRRYFVFKPKESTEKLLWTRDSESNQCIICKKKHISNTLYKNKYNTEYILRIKLIRTI